MGVDRDTAQRRTSDELRLRDFIVLFRSSRDRAGCSTLLVAVELGVTHEMLTPSRVGIYVRDQTSR